MVERSISRVMLAMAQSVWVPLPRYWIPLTPVIKSFLDPMELNTTCVWE